MPELSKRLRQPCHMLDCLMARNQAADEIERLTAANERLREALKPFACTSMNAAFLRLRDFRAARAALQAKDK